MPDTASLWVVGSLFALNGLGVGLMLAALHRAVMRDVSERLMGSAAGLYSMFRFLGATIGVALAGVVLQAGLDAGVSTTSAYQDVFLLFALFPVIGFLSAWGLGGPAR